ncbi:MAG: hypothetical protein MJ160_01665 [Treponema sp.]|nr:hypothetical protein [Treponema sp.]
MKLKSAKTIITSLIVIVIGIVLCVGDYYWFETTKNLWISIGCSLLASGLILLLTVFVIDERKDELAEWKITRIFEKRSEKNTESDPLIKKLKAGEGIDGIAFGLRTWRKDNHTDILNALNKGVNIRLITMDPDSEFTKQRSIEEGQNEDISKSIKDLIVWAQEINNSSERGSVQIKGYKCMTLDFYWRMDDIIYIGPYLLNKDSKNTITFKFQEGGKAYSYYHKYFEELWNSPDLNQLV